MDKNDPVGKWRQKMVVRLDGLETASEDWRVYKEASGHSQSSAEILEKAIQKAIDGGWEVNGHKYETVVSIYDDQSVSFHVSKDAAFNSYPTLGVKDIIFSHEFAKALWGEKDEYYNTTCNCDGAGIRVHPLQDIHSLDCAKVTSKRGYIYHLQQMVIADDPIKYLGDNI